MDKKYGNMPQYICLVFCHFSGSRLWWQQLKQENPDTPLPGQKLFLGETETFPGQPRDINSPVFPRSALGSPPRWACPKHLPGEASRRYPDQITANAATIHLSITVCQNFFVADWKSFSMAFQTPPTPGVLPQ